MEVGKAGPLERLAGCRVGVEPAEQVQVGFLDRAQPGGIIGHGAIIARGAPEGHDPRMPQLGQRTC
jgi:hypothetical protein